MTPADPDIENRRPVWRALSDLFLDTELQEHDLSYIARILAESPYTLSEIETVLYGEVYGARARTNTARSRRDPGSGSTG